MKPCNPGVHTEVTSLREGEAVTVYVSQPSSDLGGWWLHISAETDDGFFFLRRVVLTAPFRHLARVVARLVEPGAKAWKVDVEPPEGATGAIRVALITSPLERAAIDRPATDKGLAYSSGSGAATVVLPPGARVKEASVIAGPAGATMQVTVWRSATTSDALGLIPVPANSPFSFPDAELEDAIVKSVTYAGDVAGFNVAWLE